MNQELHDYLHTLITPTHVGGQTLTVEDIHTFDWAAVEDEQYHGLIATGTPTDAIAAEMLRILKPGAHVCLMAPDDCPTGHIGACTMEDTGFEIRDAILLADDPARMHYVPKPNGKERHSGTEALAASRVGPPMYVLKEDVDEQIQQEIDEALVEAGIDDDVRSNLSTTGLTKEQIPEGFSKHFTKVANPERYGNIHPTCKPKEVMRRLMLDVPKNGTIVDCFLGSGSTGLAALETGHNFIGIEREPEYAQIADARIRYWNKVSGGWAPASIKSEADTSHIVMKPKGDLFDMFNDDEE